MHCLLCKSITVACRQETQKTRTTGGRVTVMKRGQICQIKTTGEHRLNTFKVEIAWSLE